MLVLGIDPGTRFVGYGLIEAGERNYRVLNSGVIKVNPRLPFADRLNEIYKAISSVIQKSHADHVAVEEVFVSKNAKTTLRLGHARGVILLAAIQRDKQIVEYSPREVKQAILGNGGAAKQQIQWMIGQLLTLDHAPQEDEADALAVALCHCYRESRAVKTIPRDAG